MKRLILILGIMVVLLGAGKAQATLIDQGNGLVYDDVTHLSWTQNANLSPTGNYFVQLNWVDGFSLAGYSDFRLATIDELIGLYAQLPGAPGSNKTGAQGPFVDIQANYWSGTPVSATNGWGFRFDAGLADIGSLRHKYHGWAVTYEGTTEVPEPASIILLGLGLLGLRILRHVRREN